MLIFFFLIHVAVLFPQETGQDAMVVIADSLLNEGQYEEAVVKYQQYLNVQGKIRDDQRSTISECYGNIGLCYYKMDRYDEAIAWFLKALELQREMGDLESVASTLNNIGLNYKIRGNYDKAIEYYEQTIRIDEELGNGNEIAKTFNNIGMVYRMWGKYDRAIKYFEKSLHLKKGLGDQAGVSKSLNNMGLVYTDWKKYDQAILCFKESLEMEESGKNEVEIAIRMNNLGRIYYHRHQFDTALFYFEKTLQLHLKNQDQDQIALLYNNIGKVYLAQGQQKNAIIFLSSALDIYDKLGMEAEKATVLANLSDINRLLGYSENALLLLDSSTMIVEKLNIRYQLQQNYFYYSEIYRDIKNYEKSLAYFKKYTAMKDSVFTNEILSQLSDFQIKYEKEKDQARILALEKENLQKTNQRNAYMFTGLGIIVIALFIIIYFRQRAVHIKTIAGQKILQLEEEKKLMAAKLLVEGQEEERKRIATELHDGLGVLLSATKMQFSIISDKSPENKILIEKASRMLEQATGDVRKISHNMMPGLLTKLGFFEAVEDLFEHIGDTKDLNTVCTITGNQDRLAENKEIMLYRIVQEMVNNTLKHAQARNIELQIRVNPGILEMNYADDGKGFDFRQKLESESIGLKSIQSRVNFLNGKIDIDSKPGEGVKYALQIPV
jgi:signal transduction histidine kinase/Tfp pilus assembly protein PilF